MSDTTEEHACFFCGWEYDPSVGDPEGHIAAGTPWEAVPADWCCPGCGVTKAEFEGVLA